MSCDQRLMQLPVALVFGNGQPVPQVWIGCLELQCGVLSRVCYAAAQSLIPGHQRMGQGWERP